MAWLSCCIRQLNLYHLSLLVESHALKRGAASSLGALQLASYKINLNVGWNLTSNSLLNYRWAITIEPIDRVIYADVLHWAWPSWVG